MTSTVAVHHASTSAGSRRGGDLLEALDSTHEIGVDTEALEAFAATVESQSRTLAERLKPPEEEPLSDDRMCI